MTPSRDRSDIPLTERQARKPRRIGLPVHSLDDTTLLLLWLAVIAGMVILTALGLIRLSH